MASKDDVERRGEYKVLDTAEDEEHALLPTSTADLSEQERPTVTHHKKSYFSRSTQRKYNALHLWTAFTGGVLACVVAQVIFNSCCSSSKCELDRGVHVSVPTHVGSGEWHNYPPESPTNAFPSYFPTDIGYAGPTPTGAEAALVKTAPAYPIHSGAPVLLQPSSKDEAEGDDKKKFDMFKYWGNLSPWYSVEKGTFGVDSGPDPPEGCAVTGLHFLHRHGARYPTRISSYAGPVKLANRLHDSAASWTASGELSFLNDWTYKLGEEVLTPFGRQQLYDLGVSLRIKYGFLLENFTASNTIPVFRTESQDRMLHSALHFAVGFFGLPLEGKYQQSVTIEANGFNNTLAPDKTCPNAHVASKADRAIPYVKEWNAVYLADAQKRLNGQLNGLTLSFEDVYTMQQLCAYETVALGYSKFCELFTEEEWEGFEYSMDLYFWYNSAFGAPLARAQGVGYVQELVARLTKTRVETHNTSTNGTLDDNPITFPLNQSLYVDATHEVVVLNVITALNLSNFAESGPLPSDHIPERRTFIASQLAPFATNVQFQLLSCSDTPSPQIRVIINDGVTPLTGIRGCSEDRHGRCAVDTFVAAQKEIISKTDWAYDCHGDWSVPAGPAWNTTTGDTPR